MAQYEELINKFREDANETASDIDLDRAKFEYVFEESELIHLLLLAIYDKLSAIDKFFAELERVEGQQETHAKLRREGSDDI